MDSDNQFKEILVSITELRICVALTSIQNLKECVFKWQTLNSMKKSLIVIMNVTVMATRLIAITSERLKRKQKRDD